MSGFTHHVEWKVLAPPDRRYEAIVIADFIPKDPEAEGMAGERFFAQTLLRELVERAGLRLVLP